MTLNKWTVGLVSAGLVSLASVASAEEQANAVLTALSSTTISGFVDTSAQWNFDTGNVNLPAYRFGGPGKADGFNLNVVQLRIEKPLDETEWAAGYRVDMWMGPDAKALGTSSYLGDLSAGSDFALRQAYVALRMPAGNGIDWKMGVFDSIIGYESLESVSNPNYTRSYGHSFQPQTHTGLLGSYRVSELFQFSAGIANTIGPSINSRAHSTILSGLGMTADVGGDKAESYKSYMASASLTAPDSLGWLAGSTLYGGIVGGYNNNESENQTSLYAGATIASPVTGLRFGAAVDYVDVHHRGGETWSVAGYASYQATEKLSLHARGEYLRDRGTQQMLDMATGEVFALTATAQYDLWQNVISRVELRWDNAVDGKDAFGGSEENPDMENAWMLAANIIYRF